MILRWVGYFGLYVAKGSLTKMKIQNLHPIDIQWQQTIGLLA